MKLSRPNRLLLASASRPADLHLECEAAVEIAAAAGDGKPSLPTFAGTAYTGGVMQTSFSYHPVVIDLAGLKAGSVPRPILLGHDPSQIVGHTTEIAVRDGKVTLSGVVSATGPAADQVVGSAKNGFPWKMSLGLAVARREFVGERDTVTVNGRTFRGPVVIARESRFLETSFVPIAADDRTGVRVAASHFPENQEMNFDAWLQAHGFDPEQLTDAQRQVLKAQYDAEQAALTASHDPPANPPQTPQGQDNLNASGQTGGSPAPDPIADLRASAAAEIERQNQIRTICAGSHADLCARAIRENLDPRDVQIEVLRASRPEGPTGSPAVHILGGELGDRGDQVLECAFGRGMGLRGDTMEAGYSDETRTAADHRFRHGLGIQELLMATAVMNGYSGRSGPGAFRDATALRAILTAAFSQALISNILSNVANKSILEAFNYVESAWRMIAKIGRVGDFKIHTRVRLTGDLTYEELTETGEIRHGKIGDESLTIQADTYAKMLALTRKDIINDDLGALDGVRTKLGRGAALKLNQVFWKAFLDNAAFFTEARGNYKKGAGTALTAADPIAALAAAEQLFLDQTDPDGDTLGVSPEIVLVPNALWAPARELLVSTMITTGGASTKTKQPTSNIYAGRFTPVRSSYLGNASYTGYSAKAWYLLADPNDLAAIEIAFLGGQQAPTVEAAEVDFNRLGIQMRGYYDFGVAKQEYRAGVKMKGEA